ncbi:MAG: hypothetical protein LBC62_00345 [Treponema sp.]|nr:hypothetical protein [Treponema sp.]
MLFISCTEFFSTSLAPWAARDPDKLIPKVTANNVDGLLAQAENDPDLSLALLKKISDAAGNASSGDKAKLQNAALEAATNAAGLGQAVLGRAGEIASVDNPDDAKNLLTNAINDMSNLEAAASILTNTLPDPANDTALKNFTDTASPEDLATAAALLLAGEAKKSGDIDGYINSSFNKDSPDLSPAENLAVKMAEAAKDKYTDTGANGPLKDLLSGLGLI